MDKLTDIKRNSDEFRLFARHIIDGINSGIIASGRPDDMYEYEDTIRSVAYDALEELLCEIYAIEDRSI